MKVVAIKDRALGAFMNPFYAPSIGLAMRSFGDEIQREGSEMGKHPTDYELHELGEFNEDTGKFIQEETTRVIARGEDYKSEDRGR